MDKIRDTIIQLGITTHVILLCIISFPHDNDYII